MDIFVFNCKRLNSVYFNDLNSTVDFFYIYSVTAVLAKMIANLKTKPRNDYKYLSLLKSQTIHELNEVISNIKNLIQTFRIFLKLFFCWNLFESELDMELINCISVIYLTMKTTNYKLLN